MEAVNVPTRPLLRARIERQVNELRHELEHLVDESDRLDRMGRYDLDLLRKMDAKQGELESCLALLLTKGDCGD